MHDQLRLRRVTADDARLLWQWANDPDLRSESLTREPIPWEAHLKWLTSRLASARSRLWVMEAGGQAVGHVRCETAPGSLSATLSFYVAPEYRGRGLGTALLLAARELTLQELDVQEVLALASVTNLASCRAFEKAGFSSRETVCVDGREFRQFAWAPGKVVTNVSPLGSDR